MSVFIGRYAPLRISDTVFWYELDIQEETLTGYFKLQDRYTVAGAYSNGGGWQFNWYVHQHYILFDDIRTLLRHRGNMYTIEQTFS